MYEKEAEGLANKIRGLLNFANTNDTALLVSLGRKEADLRESIKRSPGRPNFNHLGHFIVFFLLWRITERALASPITNMTRRMESELHSQTKLFYGFKSL